MTNPTLFENIGNKLISALYTTVSGGGEDYFVHEHTEDATRSRFYGSQKTALIETVVNPNPSMSNLTLFLLRETATRGMQSSLRATRIQTSHHGKSVSVATLL